MKVYIFTFFMLVMLGCTNATNPETIAPPDVNRSDLLASPDTITVEGRQLTLSTFMWRDYMPISVPNDESIIAIVYVTAIDTVRLPATINADWIWMIYEQQVWDSELSIEPMSSEQMPNRIVRITREGPNWDSYITVDVVVRVLDGRGNTYLLRASHQRIGRTN